MDRGGQDSDLKPLPGMRCPPEYRTGNVEPPEGAKRLERVWLCSPNLKVLPVCGAIGMCEWEAGKVQPAIWDLR